MLNIYFSEETVQLYPNLHKAILHLKSSGKRLIPSLRLSTPLEDILGKSLTLMIPPLKKYTTLLEYINTVTKLINDTIDIIRDRINYRNKYFSDLLSELSLEVIEYDNENFTSGSFHVLDSEFPCYMNVILRKYLYDAIITNVTYCIISANNFPLHKPYIYLCSTVFERNNKPCSDALDDLPFSPRWPVLEMVQRLMNYLPNAIKKFQEYCIKNSIDY